MNKRALLALLFAVFPLLLAAQQLQIAGDGGKVMTLSADGLKSMPRHSVTVVNSHSQAEEKYEGVLLSDLLQKAGAPLGEKLRGKALLTYLDAGGSDNYHVLLALAEVDPDTHPNQTIVADTMNGAPLDAKQGPLKLIVSGDKRPARSVRMLTSIALHRAQ